MAIPIGIQVMLKKAAVDSDFQELLLAKRSSAAHEIDLVLHENEAKIIDTVPIAHLQKMIDQTVVPPNERPVFIGKALLPMLAVAGVATGGCTLGHRADRHTSPRHPEPSKQDIEEVAQTSDQETVEPVQEPTPSRPIQGILPDRIEPTQDGVPDPPMRPPEHE